MRAILLLMLCACSVWSLAAQPTSCPSEILANGEPSPSPNSRYTVFIQCYDPARTAYTVYAYDAESDREITLGETAADLITSYALVSEWINDTTVLIRAETGGATYNWRSAYIADVTVAGSLREVARDYVAAPRYFVTPPRIEWSIEDGLTETLIVQRYDVTTGETETLYSGACLLRDQVGDALSCHMVTPSSNQDFVAPDEAATRLILNVGDSAREVKTIEVRALPSTELLYSINALGSGFAEWVSADTVAVYNLAFDFESGGFGGLFVQFGEDGEVLAEEAFALEVGATLIVRPSWMEE